MWTWINQVLCMYVSRLKTYVQTLTWDPNRQRHSLKQHSPSHPPTPKIKVCSDTVCVCSASGIEAVSWQRSLLVCTKVSVTRCFVARFCARSYLTICCRLRRVVYQTKVIYYYTFVYSIHERLTYLDGLYISTSIMLQYWWLSFSTTLLLLKLKK
jgi:hypothetical protein